MILMSSVIIRICIFFFFFNDTATTEIYTLSLHDALPISAPHARPIAPAAAAPDEGGAHPASPLRRGQSRRDHAPLTRSEEHTSELQSRQYLVCRLLLEKKKT